MNDFATPPSPQAALQQARDALTGWMDQPDTPAAYDASMERAIASVAAIDAALAESQQAVAEPFELAQDAEQLAAWLENQFKRHGEIEDRLAAEMLRDMAKKWTPSALAPQAVSEPPTGVAGALTDFSDDDLWRFWWARPAVEEGEPDDMEAEFVAAARRIIATERTRAENERTRAWLATPVHQAAEPAASCQHRIADARNQYVKDGYVCIDCGALFRAADHGAQPQSAASDMVLVPREPTLEMYNAALISYQTWLASEEHDSTFTHSDTYRAMIAAAPSAAHEAAPVPEAMEVGEDTKRLDWLERESGEDIDNVEVWACWPAKHDRLRDAIDAAMLAARPPADGATKEGASHE